jgi:hypothetical protein
VFPGIGDSLPEPLVSLMLEEFDDELPKVPLEELPSRKSSHFLFVLSLAPSPPSLPSLTIFSPGGQYIKGTEVL